MTEQALATEQESNITAMQPAEVPQGIAPMAHLIASGQVSTDQIEKIMELQERWEGNQARKAYNKAMTVFRKTVGMAQKSASNAHLRTTYATFDDLVRAVSGPMGKAGFNYTFKQRQEANNVAVICTITHADGHAESTELKSAIEGNKGINNLQALGLTVSYLKRYTLAALTGVGTEDSDGEITAPVDLKELGRDRIVLDAVEAISALGYTSADARHWVSDAMRADETLDTVESITLAVLRSRGAG